MNHDVHDPIKQYHLGNPPPLSTSSGHLNIISQSSKSETSPSIVSRLKSLFSQTPESQEYDQSEHISIHPMGISRRTSSRFSSGLSVNDMYRNHSNTESSTHIRTHKSNPSFLDMGGAPNGATVNMFSDVKRLLTNLTIPTRHTRIESGDSRTHSPTAYSPHSVFSHAYSPTSTTFTPPLTPDSFNGLLLSPAAFSEYEEFGRYQYRFQDQAPLQDRHQGIEAQKESTSAYSGLCIQEDKYTTHRRHLSHLEGIKEGKKPARPVVGFCPSTPFALS